MDFVRHPAGAVIQETFAAEMQFGGVVARTAEGGREPNPHRFEISSLCSQ
jgi:hypothetical protein